MCSHPHQLWLQVTFLIWYGYCISWSLVFPHAMCNSSLQVTLSRLALLFIFQIHREQLSIDHFNLSHHIFVRQRPEDRRFLSRITHPHLPVIQANLIAIKTIKLKYLWGTLLTNFFIVDMILHLKEYGPAILMEIHWFSPNDSKLSWVWNHQPSKLAILVGSMSAFT